MSRFAAADLAFSRSRDAIAETEHSSPRCIAGITLVRAIRAAPSTPQRTFSGIGKSVAWRGGYLETMRGTKHEGARIIPGDAYPTLLRHSLCDCDGFSGSGGSNGKRLRTCRSRLGLRRHGESLRNEGVYV